MRAGRLRHRLTVERPVETRDAFGGVTTTWSGYATRWGAIAPQRGREALMSGQNTSELMVEIRLRHLDGLSPKMRIRSGSDVYEIRAVIDIDRRAREHVLACTRIDVSFLTWDSATVTFDSDTTTWDQTIA